MCAPLTRSKCDDVQEGFEEKHIVKYLQHQKAILHHIRAEIDPHDIHQ